jgi:hypothetical protein
VPPQDVLTSVRSMGLDPATRPLMRGRVYVLRAFDASHAEKRVLVDAHSGEVLSVQATADAGPTDTPYNPRHGRYDPPRPPASVARGAEAPDSEPILDEPLFPRAGRGAPATRSEAPAPTPLTPKAQPSPVNTAEDNKAPVGASPASAGEATMNAAAASPLPSAEVSAGASSSPGKSVPAPVAAKASSSAAGSAAKPATEFVPVTPLE